MKSVIYSKTGGPEVLSLAERPVPECGVGEVRVRMQVSGVNPTDWKSRKGSAPGEPTAFSIMVPNQDGSGIIDAVGMGVQGLRIGQRVWIWEAAYQRAEGSAQEFVVLPERQAVPLPDHASFDLGASLGIPALTAHRCLTVAQGQSGRLKPGALDGVNVLVIGGAGAVGNAAIQLAKWSGAKVVTTVSSSLKAELARKAGADCVINYQTEDVPAEIRRFDEHGIDLLVEVAPAQNCQMYPAILAPDATVSIYAFGGGEYFNLPVQSHFDTNTRFQFVLVYTVNKESKDAAVADISAAVADRAFNVGEEHGLPLHRFSLEQTADAHVAVESGAIGKVLIDVP